MEEKFTPRKLLLYIVEVILVVMFVLSAVALVQLFWVSPIGISGPSMQHTLDTGDTVYINKAFKTVDRGDVVVVYLPQDYTNYGLDWWRYTGDNDDTQRCPASRTKTFDDFIMAMPFFNMGTGDDNQGTAKDGYKMVIKRVVAVPGDTVQILDGVLTVNGVEDDRGVRDSSLSFYHVLGAEEYFIMGDNRSKSLDSSSYGPIRGSWICGKVFAARVSGKFTTKL